MRYYFSLWGVFVGIFWILFWVGLIWLAVSLARGRRHDGYGPYGHRGPLGHEPPGRSRALDVLEERYARGEISREEFLERRDVLGWAPPPPTYTPSPPARDAPPSPPAAPPPPAEPTAPPSATETAPLPPPAEETPPTTS